MEDTSAAMGGSNTSDHLTSPASDADQYATKPPSSSLSGQGESIMMARILHPAASENCNLIGVEQRIQRSKLHWSVLAESGATEDQTQLGWNWQRLLLFCCSNREDEEVAEVSNVHVFKALQAHPTWGRFFEDVDGFAEFEVGEKFAEGAQAELYHVQVTVGNGEWNERSRMGGLGYVVKVFKKGTFLRDLQFQVPRGYLQFYADYVSIVEGKSYGKSFPRFFGNVLCGVLLKSGQFAFLMEREHLDLRNLIERNMKSRSCEGLGPFSKEEGEHIMFDVALGVNWLHSHGIVHRDLKASNVLVREFKSELPKFYCFVADFECSIGVTGTGFFRAPEILQACKDRKLSERPEVFSKAVDVYGFGMVCYEVLKGKLPFEGHPLNDYDLVLNGRRPTLP
ncbi:hypothetical protein M758_6G180100 [Ceratodon purpureus]|nr:hypothetical protein M758_6G180100 [Ceratodon purpureus]KAG0614478.1 hypothetical protein M758_6G180100 [Ceratodon purpureus]